MNKMKEKDYLKFMEFLYEFISVEYEISVEAFINEDEAKEIIKDFERQHSAILKFNSGNGAILCSGCGSIIRAGSMLTEEDWLAMKGELILESQFCDECKLEKRKKYLNTKK